MIIKYIIVIFLLTSTLIADYRLVIGTYSSPKNALQDQKKHQKILQNIHYNIRKDGIFYVLEVTSLKTKGIAKSVKKALHLQDAYIKSDMTSAPIVKKKKKPKEKIRIKPKNFITLYKIALPKRQKTAQNIRDIEKIGKIFATLDNYPLFEIYIRNNRVMLENIEGIVNAKTLQATLNHYFPKAKSLKQGTKSLKSAQASKKQKMAYKETETSYIQQIATPFYKIESRANMSKAEAKKAHNFFVRLAEKGEYSLKSIINDNTYITIISGIDNAEEAEAILNIIVPYYHKSVLKKYYVLEMR